MNVDELLDRYGTTYADQARITLRDKPAPLFQLLVLSMLSATRISAGIAAQAARELFAAGWRTPERMRRATWQQRVDALGRGSYRRYDESTSTALGRLSEMLLDEYAGDLRRLRPDSHDSVGLERALTGFPRIGPTGARIFCREVQRVWPVLAPYFDDRCLQTAGALGLPTDSARLAATVPENRVAALAAALTRCSLEQ